ncbi:yrdC domain-containing protein, mitochondrial [Salvia divinorum]|uniref:Threonylcarbamoyl-AMP synthase n=1 Tax=Salvia divinorum TaxID=28513 RepID=A0ABD1GM54_SALDI
MRLTVPTKLTDPQSLPLLFSSSIFQRSTRLRRLQFLPSFPSRRMAWDSEICDEKTVEPGLVRPATADYAGEAIIQAVKAGKVIAVPTDTLYGFAYIQRFTTTHHLPLGLLDSLLPGPVTVDLRRGDLSILEKSLNPGLESIGVRVPDCDFIRLIARGSQSALALTSANLSGKPSSVDVKDFENLWQHCAGIYNGGLLPSGRAGSTVVDLTKPREFKILRPGSAKEETIAILERYTLVEENSVS